MDEVGTGVPAACVCATFCCTCAACCCACCACACCAAAYCATVWPLWNALNTAVGSTWPELVVVDEIAGAGAFAAAAACAAATVCCTTCAAACTDAALAALAACHCGLVMPLCIGANRLTGMLSPLVLVVVDSLVVVVGAAAAAACVCCSCCAACCTACWRACLAACQAALVMPSCDGANRLTGISSPLVDVVVDDVLSVGAGACWISAASCCCCCCCACRNSWYCATVWPLWNCSNTCSWGGTATRQRPRGRGSLGGEGAGRRALTGSTWPEEVVVELVVGAAACVRAPGGARGVAGGALQGRLGGRGLAPAPPPGPPAPPPAAAAAASACTPGTAARSCLRGCGAAGPSQRVWDGGVLGRRCWRAARREARARRCGTARTPWSASPAVGRASRARVGARNHPPPRDE